MGMNPKAPLMSVPRRRGHLFVAPGSWCVRTEDVEPNMGGSDLGNRTKRRTAATPAALRPCQPGPVRRGVWARVATARPSTARLLPEPPPAAAAGAGGREAAACPTSVAADEGSGRRCQGSCSCSHPRELSLALAGPGSCFSIRGFQSAAFIVAGIDFPGRLGCLCSTVTFLCKILFHVELLILQNN